MTAGAASQQAAESTLAGVAQGDAPLLEQLVDMNLDSLERSGLEPETYFLVRLAALVALDAAPASYLMNLGLAADAGVDLARAQSTLIAIAPLVGSARVVSAAGDILRAYGMATVLTEGGAPGEE